MLTTVLVALLGAITVVNGQCPGPDQVNVSIAPDPIPTCGRVDTSVDVTVNIYGSMYNSSQPFMLNAGTNTVNITGNVTQPIVVPQGVGYVTVTCNGTVYVRANTTMKGPPPGIRVSVAVPVPPNTGTVTVVATPSGCEDHCNYYNVSYLPSDGGANDAVDKRYNGTSFVLTNLMKLTMYNVTVVCGESSNVYDSIQFTTSTGNTVNPVMLLMVLSTLIGILMTAQG